MALYLIYNAEFSLVKYPLGLLIIEYVGVINLAEQKDKKTKHLRSARQWLTRAEESFDKDREVRGELNLFLAQAELQHAQETSHNRGWMRKYPIIRHGLAVIVAVTLASFAYGVYNQSSESVATLPPPATTQLVQPSTAVDKNVAPPPQPAIAPKTTAVQQAEEPAAQQTPSRKQTVEKIVEPVAVQSTEQRPPVSSEEMKNLIRAAGKSLRGE